MLAGRGKHRALNQSPRTGRREGATPSSIHFWRVLSRRLALMRTMAKQTVNKSITHPRERVVGLSRHGAGSVALSSIAVHHLRRFNTRLAREKSPGSKTADIIYQWQQKTSNEKFQTTTRPPRYDDYRACIPHRNDMPPHASLPCTCWLASTRYVFSYLAPMHLSYQSLHPNLLFSYSFKVISRQEEIMSRLSLSYS